MTIFLFISTRECKPGGFLKPRVCGFDGLQTRVPGYPGLIIHQSGGRLVLTVSLQLVHGHLPETDLGSIIHNSVCSRFVYDTYKTMKATRTRHG